MLFKSAIAVTIAATTAVAAPLAPRDSDFFSPTDTWLYSVNNGAISATTHGEVYKNSGNGGKDITTLVTFVYPDEAEGLQCQFEFYLDSTAGVGGSKKLDVFTSNSPAPGPTSGWGPGNQRNIHLGRLSVDVDSTASWVETYNSYLTEKTPCKAPGTTEGFELVGVYDNDSITWNPDLAGLRIVYSP